MYMGRFLSPHSNNKNNLNSNVVSNEEATANELPNVTKSLRSKENLNWLNALLGRLFYDFLTDSKWTKAVQNKVQHKISKIHVSIYIIITLCTGKWVLCSVE